METKPNIQIDNEVREMTEEEFESYKDLQTEAQAGAAAQEAKKQARESALAKLAALGLTEEEIAAL
jgi:DNA-binding NarL/FixJ family response regulator